MAIPKRCVGSKVCILQFPYFHVPTWEVALVTFQSAPSGAHMWNREVIGVRSLCLEGLVDFSIQAEDIIIYLCAFQGTFGCFFANIAVLCPS